MQSIGSIDNKKYFRTIFSCILMLLSSVNVLFSATSARASTYYHSYCNGYSSCQNSIAAIYLDVSCNGCETDFNNPNQKAVYTVRAQASNVILDSLTVTTSNGTSTIGATSLKNCNYSNTCHFSFDGKARTGNLYGHSGTNATTKTTSKPTYSPRPSSKPTYSQGPKVAYSPKPIVKYSAPISVKKKATHIAVKTTRAKPVVKSSQPKAAVKIIPKQVAATPTPFLSATPIPSSLASAPTPYVLINKKGSSESYIRNVFWVAGFLGGFILLILGLAFRKHFPRM